MSDLSGAVEEAADRLYCAKKDGVACAPVREILPEGDLDAAYAVQKLNTNRTMSSGRRLVGRKIGLTSLAVQKQLGVDQPDYGMLFDDMAVGDGLEIPAGRLIQPKVEAEIAFIIGKTLEGGRLTIADLFQAIDYAVAAIEIVDSRIKDWDIRIVDTIADNASSGLFILGSEPRRLGDFDPKLCGMVMECMGEPVSVGAGAACLGSPYNAALWLARRMAGYGQPLRSGDIVLSGALGPMVAAKPGDVFEARINGLGSVRAVFGA